MPFAPRVRPAAPPSTGRAWQLACRRGGRRAAVTVAVLVTALVAPPAASSDAATAGHELVLPPVYGTELPRVVTSGDASGLAWIKDSYDDNLTTVQYYSYAAGKVVDSGVRMNPGFTLVGTEITGTLANGSVAAIDIRDGSVRILDADMRVSTFLGGTGDGWLATTWDSVLGEGIDYTRTGDRSTFYPVPALEGVSAQDETVDDEASDTQGAVLFARAIDGSGKWSLSYLDFATGDYTTLLSGDTPYSGISAAVSGAWLVWSQDEQVHWVPRSDPAAAPSTFGTPNRVGDVAVSGDDVALTYARSGHWAVESGPLGGPMTTADALLVGEVMPADNGDFAVRAGDTVRTVGVYRLTPGASTLGPRIVAFGASAPLGIEASAGRLLTKLPTRAGTTVERPVAASEDDTRLSAGGVATLTPTSTDSDPPVSSGGHSARLECRGSTCTAVVQDGADVIARYDVPRLAYRVALSGQWLLVAVTSDTETAGVPDDGYTIVIDLDSGDRIRLPQTTALSGSRVAYLLRSGEVDVRDVATGEVRVVRAAGAPPDAAPHFRPATSIVELSGDWVLWVIPTANGTPAEAEAVDLRTGRRVDLPGTTPATGGDHAEIELADGVAAWIDPGDRAVHLFDLVGGGDEVVGEARARYPNRDWLALTDEFVAWVAPDDTTHVLALDGAVPVPPAPLGGITPPAVSPDGDGHTDSYRPQLDASRPLASWTMTVRKAGGKKVRTLNGAARDGGIRPTWNGRNGSGRRVRDGLYRWSVTGTAPTGRMRPMVGRVRVDTTAPTASVRAVAHSHIRVRWHSSEPGSSFIVRVSKRVRRHGHHVWRHNRRWLGPTQRTHAAYRGRSVPYRPRAGTRLRFTVVAVDAAGNRSHGAVTRVTAR